MGAGTFSAQLLPLLRCPHCDSTFDFEPVPAPTEGSGEFGVLRCRCADYPVLDDVPIIQRTHVGMFEHTRGTVESAGASIGTLVELVRRGDSTKALLECIVPSGTPGDLLRRCLGWRRSGQLARYLAQRKFRHEVLDRRLSVTAIDVLEHFYLRGGPLDPSMGHYFIRRFATPRHLAALSLACCIPMDAKPILDIACGIGSLAHYFTQRPDSTGVVGLDMNFYHLWLAKHWVAPLGNYVCASADDPLPFRDQTFSGVFCSDAYHYLSRNRKALLEQIRRCAPDRIVVITRVGNRDVMPNEGAELDLGGYLSEFDASEVRIFDEDELVRHYLRRSNPFAHACADGASHAGAKWFSFAWNTGIGVELEDGYGEIPPHAIGEIGWNPIYRRSTLANGDLQLRFEFPIVWYAYENHAMLAYHPLRLTVPKAKAQHLPDWKTDSDLRALVDSFALIGLPHRFTGD